jgi:ParB family transcriptional regulator, chromosome partitioning protein
MSAVALLPQEHLPVPVRALPTGTLAYVGMKRIVTGRNPRTLFDPDRMAELEDAIRAVGCVLEPIIVRRVLMDVGDVEVEFFQIVAGERRFRAAGKVLGDEYEMPVHILELDDKAAAAAALIENKARENLNPVEEAEAAAQLLGELANDKAEAARWLGMSVPQLERLLGLMNATPTVRKALAEKRILIGHAELIAAAEKSKQDKILEALLAKTPMPSPAQLRDMLAKIARPLASACFDTSACVGCPQNSSRQATMFTEVIEAGNCTGPECYTAKTETVLEAKRLELVDTWPRVEIVRTGGNYTVIKLKVEGPDGVGQEQGTACRQCKNFGAAISTVPGKEGRVYEDMCFDTPCNTRMVSRHMRQQAAEAAASDPNAAAHADAKSGSAKPGAKKPKRRVTAVATLSAAVVDFRKKLWRKAFESECVATPERALSLLLAMAASGNAGKIDSSNAVSALDEAMSTNGAVTAEGMTMEQIQRQLVGCPREAMAKVILKLGQTAADRLDIDDVQGTLAVYGTNLANFFKLDEEYLNLLTKTEIAAVADEVGLAKAIGEKFKALANQKKGDFITALLGVTGFDYAVVPQVLRYDTPDKA